ncbi:MAG: DNA-binding protein [Marinobacter sp.]|nr:DNA-binding protein [Marinobacter sp.]
MTEIAEQDGRVGRPSEYDDARVIQVGESLVEAGRRVTGYALRRLVGGGDPNRHIRIWRAHQQRKEVVESEPVQELPVEVDELLRQLTGALADQIRGMAVRLNTIAVQTAERRVADVMAGARETQDQAEAELADAAATVEDLEKQLERLQRENAELTAKLAEAVAFGEAEHDALTLLKANVAVLNGKLEAEQEQRATAETTVSDLKQRNAELAQDKADLKAERDRLKQDVDELRKERESLVDVRGELKAQLATLSEREAGVLRRASAAETERSEATAKVAQLEAQVIQLKEQLAALDRSGRNQQKAGAKKPKQEGG